MNRLEKNDSHHDIREIRESRARGGEPLIIASNRGPIEYHLEAGALVGRRGKGGVVTALAAATARIAEERPVVWVASALTEGDCLASAGGPTRSAASSLTTHFLIPDQQAYDLYYSVSCNPVLWFLHHGLWGDLSTVRDEDSIAHAWSRGYLPVNRQFARAIADAAGGNPRPRILLHDYHLYAAPAYIRSLLPEARIGHFVHVPWPEPPDWNVLPRGIVRDIFSGLCACDRVDFQTPGDAERFLLGCATFFPEAWLDFAGSSVCYHGQVTRVHANPITIDVGAIQRRAVSGAVQECAAKLRPLCGEKTLVRIDRLDPSKNVVRGFTAVALLLEQHPELLGRLRFLAFLVPSRTTIGEYRVYEAQVMAAARAVNERFATDGWRPVQIFHEDNYDQAIAALTLYDVLLVNSIADGMNLVAKEGAAVNQQNGVLVLSRAAGAHYQLGAGALAIDPRDVAATAQALWDGVTMSDRERESRQRRLRSAVSEYGVADWLSRLLEDHVQSRERQRVEIGRPTVRAFAARGAPVTVCRISLPARTGDDRGYSFLSR